MHTELRREAMKQFERLLDFDAAEQAAELAALAARDPELHIQVERLFAADRAAEARGFLGSGAEQRLRSMGGFGEPEPGRLQAGGVFGVYRLERPLGSGGMGEVWLATRVDGLYEGKVAIKTLHAHLSQAPIRERFAREGRILGRLTHPNVARLLDAGIAEDGQLYLVIEYVAGEHLGDWCDARRLGIAARLQLFLQVCDAVAHAHVQLVVHRDLKPSNILVTESGEPKLLDFGIAKLIEGDADSQPGAATALTRIGGRALTPEYAAPEQLLGEPVSTATDVYALGLLLYELLCGLRPFGAVGKTALQLERAVLETEPRPLTQSITRRDAGERFSAIERAALRSLSPAALRKALRGDLDTILRKALRREPEQRYASVSAFADDLRRHLAHEPVTAQPDALGYRAAKFLRRYRLGVAAAALVIAALAIGLGAALWQAQLARTEARKAEAVKDFLLAIFRQNSINHPDGAAASRTTAAELLDVGASSIRSQLDDVPEVRAELLSTLGALYYNLMLPEPALAVQREAVATLSSAFGANDLRTLTAQVRLGASLIESAGEYEEGAAILKAALAKLDGSGRAQTWAAATAAQFLGQWAYHTLPAEDPAAQRYFQRALDRYRRLPDSIGDQILCWQGLARVAEYAGELDAAERHYREALALAPQAAGDRDAIAGSYQQLGDLLRKRQRFDEAETMLREALRLFDKAAGPDHPLTIDARRELGKLLSIMGKRAEGVAMLADVVRHQAEVRGPEDAAMTAGARLDYGTALFAWGRFEDAATELSRALKTWRAETAKSAFLAIGLSRYGMVQLARGRTDEADALLQESLVMIEAVYGSHSRSLATTRVWAAEVLLARGRPQDAAAEFNKVLETWPWDSDGPPAHWVGANAGLIDAALALGQTDEALQLARTMVDRIAQQQTSSIAGNAPVNTAGKFPDEEALARLRLGRALLRSGDTAAAEPELSRAVTLREGLSDPGSPRLAEARVALAEARLAMGQVRQARTLYEMANAACEQHPELADSFLRPLKELRARLR